MSVLLAAHNLLFAYDSRPILESVSLNCLVGLTIALVYARDLDALLGEEAALIFGAPFFLYLLLRHHRTVGIG